MRLYCPMKMLLAILSFVIMNQAEGFAAAGEAVLKSTSDAAEIHGNIKLEETEGGLKITSDIQGAPSGRHGFHIHQFGSCADSGKAAGDHYNPHGTSHGFLPEDGAENAHAGDLGNIEIGEDGKGALEMTLPSLSLTGENAVAGRSFILHENADQFTQPAGDAGGRIACGIIGLVKED